MFLIHGNDCMHDFLICHDHRNFYICLTRGIGYM